MGQLVNGKWEKGDIITSDSKGAFDRNPSTFRETINSDHPEYKPETDRYHLYVSYACPWAHRTLIFRKLKNLEKVIPISVVHPDMLEMGWSFDTNFPGSTGDALYQSQYLHQIYQKAKKEVTTKVTVPVLWDKKTETIVNNESSEIIRIFNNSFDSITKNNNDYYPQNLQGEIDSINEPIYHNINNGVYRAGFAKSQSAYDEAVEGLFEWLSKLETRLADQDYLVGNQLTEADVRLITTLLRFDIVYFNHFKCNVRRILDFPNLANYRRRLYEMVSIRETTRFDHIKRHYFYSQESVNPFRIIPRGPERFI